MYINRRKYKQVAKITSGERGSTITILCAVNAAGACVPPALICPRKYMNDWLLKGAPVLTLGLVSDSEWVNETLFLVWLRHFTQFTHFSQLLTIDGHASHKSHEVIECARENGVLLLSLPPLTTPRLEPLDRVFYWLLKGRWGKMCPWGKTQHAAVENETNKTHSVVRFSVSELLPLPKATTIGKRKRKCQKAVVLEKNKP